MIDRLTATRLNTSYEALTQGAREIRTSSWYEVSRYRLVTPEEMAHDLFGTGNSAKAEASDACCCKINRVYHDRKFGELAHAIKTTLLQVVGWEHYGEYEDLTYQVPQDSYQIDAVTFERDGKGLNALIYHSPAMALLTWQNHDAMLDGFRFMTGEAEIIIKGNDLPIYGEYSRR